MRVAGGGLLLDDPVQPGLAELGRRVGEGPHPRQEELIRLAEEGRSPVTTGCWPMASKERQREKRFPRRSQSLQS